MGQLVRLDDHPKRRLRREAVERLRAELLDATREWCDCLEELDEAPPPWDEIGTDPRVLQRQTQGVYQQLQQCYVRLSGSPLHRIWCATGRAPMLRPGPCNCCAVVLHASPRERD